MIIQKKSRTIKMKLNILVFKKVHSRKQNIQSSPGCGTVKKFKFISMLVKFFFFPVDSRDSILNNGTSLRRDIKKHSIFFIIPMTIEYIPVVLCMVVFVSEPGINIGLILAVFLPEDIDLSPMQGLLFWNRCNYFKTFPIFS